MAVTTTVQLVLQVGQALDISKQPAPGTVQSPYLPWAFAAGGVVATALLFALAWRALRGDEDGVPVVDRERDDTLTDEDRQRLDELLERGSHEQAGDILARADRPVDAAEHYLRDEAYRKAAESFRDAGETAQAIHYYKKAELPERAARLYLQDEDHRGAAAVYVHADEPLRAAKCYRKAGDHRRAAKAFVDAGHHRRAGKSYEQAGSQLLAARAYRTVFNAGEDAGERVDDEDVAKVGSRAARLFESASEFDEAARIFERLGRREAAARCHESAGSLVRAAELFGDTGRSDRAAELLETVGERDRALEAKAEAAVEAQDWQTAAEAFEEARDLERAAAIYAENLDAPPKAAELYEELESWLDASQSWERAEDYAAAAECAEKGGSLARAAELYREVGDIDSEIQVRISQGDFFRAARLLYEQRRYGEALETVQRINSRDPIYKRGLELQGDILRAQQNYEDAYARYRAALGNRQLDESTVQIVYKMGRVLEGEQDFPGAAQHYDRVLEIAPDFEDTRRRLETIQKGLSEEREKKLRATSAGKSISEADKSPGISVAAKADDAEPESELRYEFEDVIARGGMGVVYRARDTFLNRIVAVKLLGEKLRGNETAVKYFLREARAAAALSHRNIVTIFDAGEQSGEYYIAMEYVDGRTLKEILKAKGPLPETYVRHVMIQSCRALEYAHNEGVVHRDIKSGNIMCKTDNTVKIMDFGLAKFIREYEKEHTQQVGTPYYMSPEQIIGQNIDFRSDLYGLGCTAFECVTGRVPFSEGELAYHHVHTAPPAPKSVNSSVGDRMNEIILRLLQKDPEDRFASATDLREVLESM